MRNTVAYNLINYGRKGFIAETSVLLKVSVIKLFVVIGVWANKLERLSLASIISSV